MLPKVTQKCEKKVKRKILSINKLGLLCILCVYTDICMSTCVYIYIYIYRCLWVHIYNVCEWNNIYRFASMYMYILSVLVEIPQNTGILIAQV